MSEIRPTLDLDLVWPQGTSHDGRSTPTCSGCSRRSSNRGSSPSQPSRWESLTGTLGPDHHLVGADRTAARHQGAGTRNSAHSPRRAAPVGAGADQCTSRAASRKRCVRGRAATRCDPQRAASRAVRLCEPRPRARRIAGPVADAAGAEARRALRRQPRKRDRAMQVAMRGRGIPSAGRRARAHYVSEIRAVDQTAHSTPDPLHAPCAGADRVTGQSARHHEPHRCREDQGAIHQPAARLRDASRPRQDAGRCRHR
jgi:hypothetical protein